MSPPAPVQGHKGAEKRVALVARLLPLQDQMNIVTAPALPPEEFDPRAQLRDGSVAALRVSRPSDHNALRRFFHELSAESRQQRFFSLADPAETLIDAFCDSSDPTRQATLVALRLEDEGLRPVAIGSYLDLGNGVAEAAFAVADAVQGKGLGTILLKRLARLAAANGFRRFNAIVLSGNKAMLDVFRASGFQIGSKTQHGVVTVALVLSPPDACPARNIRARVGTHLGAVLRAGGVERRHQTE